MTYSHLHLPEEILDRILHYTTHRPTIHTLCTVSKALNCIATPYLYHSIALRKDDFQYLRPLALLLWTSPKHRDIVHSISVKQAYGGNLVRWPDHPQLDDILRHQIELYVREGDKGKWFERVRDGIDALPVASLLLRSLPNVQRMPFEGFEMVDPGAGIGRAKGNAA
jgi:hypothetical protein